MPGAVCPSGEKNGLGNPKARDSVQKGVVKVLTDPTGKC